LEQDYKAIDFLPALTAFLRNNVSTRNFTQPGRMDCFDVFKQVSIIQPPNPRLSDKFHCECIRAVPAIPRKGRKPERCAYFDTALFKDASSGLGMRVGQVRVIFTLPPQLGKFPHPLAYVEWFTPLHKPDKLTRLYQISRSTRHQKRNATVISMDQLIGSCHLVGKTGRNIDPSWSMENVLDKALYFSLNRYITLDDFSQM
jgi:hypothetical protein